LYQDDEVRSDAVHEFSINPDSPGEFDANGGWRDSDDESGLLGLCCTSFGARIQQKQRSGITAVWEWKVSDSFSMSVDGLFTGSMPRQSAITSPTMSRIRFSMRIPALHRWSDVSISDHW
jgi:hypothetical protein